MFTWCNLEKPDWLSLDDVFGWIDGFSDGTKKKDIMETIIVMVI